MLSVRERIKDFFAMCLGIVCLVVLYILDTFE